MTGVVAAGDPRIPGLLTRSEAAVQLGRSVKTVTRLADAGELERVRLGALTRITPESVAAYRQRLIAGAEAARSS